MILRNKKGFAFSFIALFLSMLVFSFVALDLFQENYNQKSNFDSSRVLKISQENKYFQDIYFIDALKFSLYNSLSAVLNHSSSDSVFYSQLQKNSSRLNDFFQEILVNGTLNSQTQPIMYNKTIYNLTKNYIDSYEQIQRGNIDYKILSIRVFEETPFYVDFQVLTYFNITNQDNIASWEFNKSFEVSVPIFELKDPKFELFAPIDTDDVPVIRSSTYFQGNQNWTLQLLNETILNTFSTIYVEPNTKYTIGSSYLSSLLNVTLGAYRDVDGFWSFDHDLDENLIYDTSLTNQNGTLYGNTLLGLSFNNGTFFSNEIEDISNYENNITYTNLDRESNFIKCISAECIILDESSSIEIDESLFNIPGNKLSISMWFNTSSYNDSLGDGSYLFKYGSTSNEEILIYFDDGKLYFELGEHGTSSRKIFRTISNVTLDTWNHLLVTYNGDIGDGVGKIYLNGDVRNSRDNQESSNPISSFSSSSSPINIGSNSGSSNYFNGGIDEFVIYSRDVISQEVSNIYTQRRIQLVDYVDALHGDGIFLNGFNNYLEIEDSQNQFQYDTNEFSSCTWFKPDLVDRGSNLQTIIDKSNSTNGFKLGINLSSNTTFAQFSGNTINSNKKLSQNRWYFSCLTRDSSNTFRLYLNDKLENSLSLNVDVSSNSNLFFGKSSLSDDQNFSGVLDEVKIFSRQLSPEEIQRDYFSFNTFAKGCCNTLSLVDTNKFGFNDSTSYNQNVSFSSKLFIDYYFRDEALDENILYEVDNITSTQTNQNFYNAYFDSCLIQVFNVADYTEKLGESIVYSPSPNTGINCYELILDGVY